MTATAPTHSGWAAQSAPRRIALLAIVLALSVVALEVGTRFTFSRISRIEKRTSREYAEARAIRPVQGRPSFLLLGNSLPLMAVDPELLKSMLPREIRPYRFIIESTELFDWKYGLRRLFDEGSRPDVVILSVGNTSMQPTKIRGEYSAFYLFRTSDLGEIADSLHFDNTQRSSLYFARHSLYFAGRSGLRNFTLNRIDPPFGELLHALVTSPGLHVASPVVEAAVEERLSEMRAVAERHGSKLVLLVPPGFAKNIESAVLAGAKNAGVPVLAPVPQNAWDNKMFSDGFHLNSRGAATFTRLLAPQLAAMLILQK